MPGMHWASAGCMVNVARMVRIIVTLDLRNAWLHGCYRWGK